MPSMYEFKTLNISVTDNGIADLVINTPKKGNPFGPELWTDLGNAFPSLSDDKKVRVIVIRTEKKNFSYGLDLMEAAPIVVPAIHSGLEGQQHILDLGKKLQHALNVIADAKQPVIAAVNGWCIGAGLELISACDIRLCSEDAKFSLREVKVGMVADLGGLQRLPFIIGEGHMREMALTGSDYSAEWAKEKGLVNYVLSDLESLKNKAIEIAESIAANPPLVVNGVKEVLNERIEQSVNNGLRNALRRNSTLMQSKDFQEAIAAFMDQRSPNFTGE